MVDGSMVGLEGVNIISVQSVQHGGKVGNPLKWPPLTLLRELREVFYVWHFFWKYFRVLLNWVLCGSTLERRPLENLLLLLLLPLVKLSASAAKSRRTASSAIMMTDRELLVIDMKRRNMQLDPFPYPQKYGLKLDSCVIKWPYGQLKP